VCCYVDHRLCVVVFFYFGHVVICPSIFDVLNAPLVCSTLFYVNIFVPHVLGELCKINRIILNVWCKYHFIDRDNIVEEQTAFVADLISKGTIFAVLCNDDQHDFFLLKALSGVEVLSRHDPL
jgi:hypothetical protein